MSGEWTWDIRFPGVLNSTHRSNGSQSEHFPAPSPIGAVLSCEQCDISHSAASLKQFTAHPARQRLDVPVHLLLYALPHVFSHPHVPGVGCQPYLLNETLRVPLDNRVHPFCSIRTGSLTASRIRSSGRKSKRRSDLRAESLSPTGTSRSAEPSRHSSGLTRRMEYAHRGLIAHVFAQRPWSVPESFTLSKLNHSN